jgi:hypothetical protein
MSATQSSAISDLLPVLSRDIIEAIADRPRESEARRTARARNAFCLIEAFECEDEVEIMLAGQIVLLRSVMLDSLHDARHSPCLDSAHKHRQQALMTVRLQLAHIKEIDHRQAARPSVAVEAVAAQPVVASKPEAEPEAPEVRSDNQIEPPIEPIATQTVETAAGDEAITPPVPFRSAFQPPTKPTSIRPMAARTGT